MKKFNQTNAITLIEAFSMIWLYKLNRVLYSVELSNESFFLFWVIRVGIYFVYKYFFYTYVFFFQLKSRNKISLSIILSKLENWRKRGSNGVQCWTQTFFSFCFAAFPGISDFVVVCLLLICNYQKRNYGSKLRADIVDHQVITSTSKDGTKIQTWGRPRSFVWRFSAKTFCLRIFTNWDINVRGGKVTTSLLVFVSFFLLHFPIIYKSNESHTTP